MAGEAKTSKFLLSEATVMIGPSDKVFELTPADHGIGLTKSVRMEVTHGWTELTQGVTSQVVYSVNTSIESMISAEIYEYTAKNLAYAAQLDATDVNYAELALTMTLAAPIDDSDTDIVLTTGQGTNFAVGDYVVLQKNAGDTVAVVKISAKSTDTLTIDTAGGFALPTGVTWTVAGTKIYRVRKPIAVGESETPMTYGVKIVGLLPEGKRPVTMIFPKVRVMKGLNLAFDSQNFSNMPFEFKPYALLPEDDFYATLPVNGQFMVLPA